MARVRATPGSQATTKTAAARQALKETTNTARAPGPIYEDDGVTDDLIKDAKPKRGRPKKVVRQDSEELVMAGGLGLASEDNARHNSEVPTTTDELAKSDSVPGPIAKSNRRPPRTVRKITTSEAQSKVLDGLKERMNATAQGQRAKQKAPTPAVTESCDSLPLESSVASKSRSVVAESPGPSLSPSPSPARKVQSVQNQGSSVMQPGSVLRAQSTPAVEHSLLALKNFKRRPRQPSMLQMVKQKIGSARPSLLNTTTVTMDDNALGDEDVFDLGASDDDEEDFAPEAEGTPLHVNKIASNLPQNVKLQPSDLISSSGNAQKKRKSDALDVSSGSLSALRAKRQRHDQDISSGSLAALRGRRQGQDSRTLQVQDPPVGVEVVVSSSIERAETPQPHITSDVQVINSPASSTPPTEPSSSQHQSFSKDSEYAIPSTERAAEIADAEARPRGVFSDDDGDDGGVPNGTMADPISSPLPISDDVFADPSTQRISPSPVKKGTNARVKPLNTAALQSLLPKRRKPVRTRNRRSEYDIDSTDSENEPLETSHLDEDEDELGGRVKRQTKTAPAKSKKSTTAKRGRPRKVATKKTAVKKVNMTYGRHTASDKENDGSVSFDEADESTLPEISRSMEELAKSTEIEAAKAKFADIDKWDMEFESVDADEHRSSSLNWR